MLWHTYVYAVAVRWLQNICAWDPIAFCTKPFLFWDWKLCWKTWMVLPTKQEWPCGHYFRPTGFVFRLQRNLSLFGHQKLTVHHFFPINRCLADVINFNWILGCVQRRRSKLLTYHHERTAHDGISRKASSDLHKRLFFSRRSCQRTGMGSASLKRKIRWLPLYTCRACCWWSD